MKNYIKKILCVSLLYSYNANFADIGYVPYAAANNTMPQGYLNPSQPMAYSPNTSAYNDTSANYTFYGYDQLDQNTQNSINNLIADQYINQYYPDSVQDGSQNNSYGSQSLTTSPATSSSLSSTMNATTISSDGANATSATSQSLSTSSSDSDDDSGDSVGLITKALLGIGIVSGVAGIYAIIHAINKKANRQVIDESKLTDDDIRNIIEAKKAEYAKYTDNPKYAEALNTFSDNFNNKLSPDEQKRVLDKLRDKIKNNKEIFGEKNFSLNNILVDQKNKLKADNPGQEKVVDDIYAGVTAQGGQAKLLSPDVQAKIKEHVNAQDPNGAQKVSDLVSTIVNNGVPQKITNPVQNTMPNNNIQQSAMNLQEPVDYNYPKSEDNEQYADQKLINNQNVLQQNPENIHNNEGAEKINNSYPDLSENAQRLNRIEIPKEIIQHNNTNVNPFKEEHFE